MTMIDALRAGGILRPTEVVEIATATGLDLAIACVLLQKESGGGRNVWGSDPVDTDHAYSKGGPVTESNYRAYRRSVEQGRAGWQGVGPCQLTWRGYQDLADARGGCWDWRTNCLVGFDTLRDLQRQYGVRNGFRRYNGSSDAAERYADDAMIKFALWQSRIGAVPAASKRTSVKFGDGVPPQRPHAEVRHLQTFARRVFTGYAPAVVDGVYGDDTVRFVREFQRRVGITGPDADGRSVGPRTLAALARFGY